MPADVPKWKREQRAKNPDRFANLPPRTAQSRRAQLLRRYGITPEEYDAMLERQGGHCAICPRPPGTRRLHVDHDHVTGRVRGLLCGPCNGALHYLENGAWLAAATDYLQA